MKNAFRLAWRHLCFHRVRAVILVLCLTLTLALPLCLQFLVERFQTQLRERAAATPLVIGAPGSQFDLAVCTLYFDARPPPAITMKSASYVRETGFATSIPMHLKFRTADGSPIVGTTSDYFTFRQSALSAGTPLIRLGDCVLGSAVARATGKGVGDRVLSQSENVFDLSGSYPLDMRVVGVLAPANTPDDRAVFVDLKTAWLMEGIGHGHMGLETEHDEDLVLQRDDKRVTASAAIVKYMKVTDDNIDSFHFHGDEPDFPISSVIAVPHDERSGVLLSGRFTSEDSVVRIVQPSTVVEQLLSIVFRIKKFFDAAAWLIGIVTLLFLTLVTLLTLRLRKREMETMFKLGCSRGTIAKLQAAEMLIVLGAGLVFALGIAGLVQHFGAELLRRLLF